MDSTKRFRVFAICLLAVMVLTGCGERPNTLSPAPLSSPTVPAWKDKLELDTYFRDLKGAFVLYLLKGERYARYHPAQCAERFLPASTFKILNSLIGLETGVIPLRNAGHPGVGGHRRGDDR